MAIKLPSLGLGGLLGKLRRKPKPDHGPDGDGLPEDDGADDAADAAETGDGDSAPPKKAKRNWGRIAANVTAGLIGLVLVGGLGAAGGWLHIKGPQTVAEREKQKPVLTVAILADGETAEPNTSYRKPEKPVEPHGDDAKPMDADTAGGKPGAAGAEAPKEDDTGGGAFDPDLVQRTDGGPLPIIAADGRMAWKTYAQPFEAPPNAGRLAIIIAMMGLSPSTTEAAIKTLPGRVTLSFAPYAPNLQSWIAQARKAGHEVLIELPMEPIGFPRNDPGPNTLLTSLSTVENLNRLDWVLSRAAGYVGVMATQGGQFSLVEESLSPVLDALKKRGLMLVDSRASSRSLATEVAATLQLPRAFNNRFIDSTPSASEIDRRLADLEQIARTTRVAVGLGYPLPITIDRLTAWLPTLAAKGIALAPITAIADRQSLR